MKILYGTELYSINIKKLCYEKCVTLDNLIIIPSGEENRIKLFSDPVPGNIKYIYIVKKNLNYVTYRYSNKFKITINIATNSITHSMEFGEPAPLVEF